MPLHSRIQHKNVRARLFREYALEVMRLPGIMPLAATDLLRGFKLRFPGSGMSGHSARIALSPLIADGRVVKVAPCYYRAAKFSEIAKPAAAVQHSALFD